MSSNHQVINPIAIDIPRTAHGTAGEVRCGGSIGAEADAASKFPLQTASSKGIEKPCGLGFALASKGGIAISAKKVNIGL